MLKLDNGTIGKEIYEPVHESKEYQEAFRKLECYERPFSPLLSLDDQELRELINQRINDYMKTTKFAKLESAVIETIEETGEVKETKSELTDSVTAFWTDAFDAGYKAGMVDIMTALTFNKAGITAVKYPKEA